MHICTGANSHTQGSSSVGAREPPLEYTTQKTKRVPNAEHLSHTRTQSHTPHTQHIKRIPQPACRSHSHTSTRQPRTRRTTPFLRQGLEKANSSPVNGASHPCPRPTHHPQNRTMRSAPLPPVAAPVPSSYMLQCRSSKRSRLGRRVK